MEKQEIAKDLRKKLPELMIKENEDMKKHTSFKIGGVADIFVKVKTQQELKGVIEYAKEKEIPITIIGNGSNLLVRDKGIRGITIQIGMDHINMQETEDGKVEIQVDSGVKLGMLASKLQKEGIEGFSFAAGIPGTIGGAIRMNAGAYGKEMKDIVTEVTSLKENGEIQTKKGEDLHFSYRHSRFMEEKEIILSAKLSLEKGNAEEIKRKMEELNASRKEKQPIEMPSAGSTFKRGRNFVTAQLIDEAGLKGYQIGGAQVSTKHAGFIVNTGNATAKDVLDLVDYIIKVIFEKFGKIVELEVEVVGEE